MRIGRRRGRDVPYRLLSLLLQYPSEDVSAAREAVSRAIAGVQPGEARRELSAFWSWFSARPLLEVQQHYVSTFDLQKGTSLYLTYYSDGDTRKRGQSLVDLKRAYAGAGQRLDSVELPDHLPVMLEFAALEPDLGSRLLVERRAALEMIRVALREKGSEYARLLDALLAFLPPLSVPDRQAVERFLRDGPPSEVVGLEPFAPADVMPAGEPLR